MQVISIAECFKESILQYMYFRPSLSYHLPLRSLVLSIIEWSFYTGFTVSLNYIPVVTASPVHSVHFIHFRVLPVLDG